MRKSAGNVLKEEGFATMVARQAKSGANPYDTGGAPRRKAPPHFIKEGALDLSKYRRKLKAATPKTRDLLRPKSAPAKVRTSRAGGALDRAALEHLATAHLGDGSVRKKVRIPEEMDLEFVADLRRGDLVERTGSATRRDSKARQARQKEFGARAVARPGPATSEALFWKLKDAQHRRNNEDFEVRELGALMRAEAARGAEPLALRRGARRARRGPALVPRRTKAPGNEHGLKLTVENRYARVGKKDRLKYRRGAISLPTSDLDHNREPYTDKRRFARAVGKAPPHSYQRANHRARQCGQAPADYRAEAPVVRHGTRKYTTWEKEVLRLMDIPTSIPLTEDSTNNYILSQPGLDHLELIHEPKSEITFQSPIKGNRLRDSVGIIDPDTGAPMTKNYGESCMPEGELPTTGDRVAYGTDAPAATTRGRKNRGVDRGRVAAPLLLAEELDYETPDLKFGKYSSLNPKHAATAGPGGTLRLGSTLGGAALAPYYYAGASAGARA